MFITFEGIDGSGKSTQARLLAENLRTLDHTVVLTREPGGTELGERVRDLLFGLDGRHWDPTEQALLHYAARSIHLRKVIRPELRKGNIVISDRFHDSSWAYQWGAGNIRKDLLSTLDSHVLGGTVPDMTILLDLDPEECPGRLTYRLPEDGNHFDHRSPLWFQGVREAYLERARLHSERFYIVDASQSIEVVADTILHMVREKIDEQC